MTKLRYGVITSLDGYIEDASGSFDWAEPDAEVHAFANDLERPVGTFLYGRRMYETMRYWETAHTEPDQHAVALEYAQIWQAAEKVVYSTTLTEATTAKTRIERSFDPAAVRQMKEAAGSDISVSGPELAAHALRAGLVDQIDLLVSPVVVGGGKPALPDDLRIDLELVDERRFGNGVVHLRYLTRH